MASERGIAMIWWVIVLLVLFLAAAGLAYDRYNFGEEQLRKIAEQKVLLKESQDQTVEEVMRRQELCQVVGFKAEEGGLESEPGAIKDAIERIKGTKGLEDPGQDAADTTLEAMLKRLQKKNEAVQRRLVAAEQERDRARNDEDAARESADTVKRGKDQRIAELEGEKQQVEERLTNITQTKDQEIEGLRGSVNSAKERTAQVEEEARKEKKDLVTMLEREKNLKRQASERIISIKKNNNADGKVSARVSGSNKVIVSIGAMRGVKEGTQFEVYELGKGNEVLKKGWVTIQEVKPDFSVAIIESEVDEFNPIAGADLIRNPLFESGKQPTFYLMGDMTGRLSNQQTEALIKKMGGKVVKDVTVHTDFVVLGRKESDEAVPFENRPEWEHVKDFNIEIISPEYLMQYLAR